MGNSKKSFFYNPSFRVLVYILAWVFLTCFNFYTLLNPKWKKIVRNYEDGHAKAPAIIGFASGLLFEIVFFLITHKGINLNLSTVLVLPLFYLSFGLIGWLSLVKYRDYEQEKFFGGSLARRFG